MKKYIVSAVFALGIIISPSFAHASSSGLTSTQIGSIMSVLESFGVDQATLSNVSSALNSTPATTVAPPTLNTPIINTATTTAPAVPMTTTTVTTPVTTPAPSTTPTVTISANPTTMPVGMTVFVTWSSTNATVCAPSSGVWSGSGSMQTSGTIGFTPNQPGTYTFGITCVSSAGVASTPAIATFIVTGTAIPAPVPTPTAVIVPGSAMITFGQSTTLTWSSQNAISCSASGSTDWSGTKATSGSATVTPNSAGIYYYVITCTNSAGTTSSPAIATVAVTAAPVTTPIPVVTAVPTVTISASPTSLTSISQSTVLSWSTKGGTSCSIAGFSPSVSASDGSASSTIYPGKTTTYTITCTNSAGTSSASVTVTVATTPITAAPTVTISANPASVSGISQSTVLTWSSTNATSCTLSNGSWTMPAGVGSGASSTVIPGSTTTYTVTCTGPVGTNSASTTVSVTTAPNITFFATQTSLTTGQSTTLTWSSVNATSCSASGSTDWSGTKATSGTETVTPNSAGTYYYVITCTNSAGTTSSPATATITVTTPVTTPAPAPSAIPTVTFSVSPKSITLGQAVNLTWSSSNADGCTASGSKDWVGSGFGAAFRSARGSSTVYPTVTGNSTYIIPCTNSTSGLTSTPSSVTVTVAAAQVTPAPVPTPAPAATPTVTISASSQNISVGQSTTLSWSSQNATSCSASGTNDWTGTKTTSGSATVTPGSVGTYYYAITCTNSAGTTSSPAVATVTINPAPAAAVPTVTVSASPTTITSGQSTTITWSSTNSTYCTGTGSGDGSWFGTKAASGIVTITPPSNIGTATYVVYCANSAGAGASASATITINPAPVVAPISITPTVAISASPLSITVGQPATLTWSSTNATSCTAYGGNWSGSQNTNGSITMSPSSAGSYTYSIACYAGVNTITASATVNVTSAPTASPIACPSWGCNRPAPIKIQSLDSSAAAINALDGLSGSNNSASQTQPQTSFSYVWNNDLQIGSPYSADVKALQTALTKEGLYSGDITGGFYDQTYLAVKAFQEKYGIKASGYAGLITRAKLNEIY